MYAVFGMHRPPDIQPTALALLPVSRTSIPGRGLRAVVPIVSLCFSVVLLGCGSPGAPQPPSLKLPTPPSDLSLTRSGDEVRLHWTMPRRATDRVPLSGDLRVVICRAVAAEPCHAVGEVLLLAAAPATYTDTLPTALSTGAPRLLTYSVLLHNGRGQGAGPSNVAFTAAGAAPPPVTALRVETRAPGEIALLWQPSPEAPAVGGSSPAAERLVLLHRSRRPAAPESGRPGSSETQSGVAQPNEQALTIALPPAPSATLAQGWTLDHATDRDAALNRTYTYSVERVARLVLGGHPVEVSSVPSAPVTIVAQDTFAPALPAGLEAVADPEAGTIDLSWAPDTDPDLAGYFVYRRLARAETLPVRVSGSRPLVNPAWRDASAQPGVLYAYSVSAIDASGNESPRCPETQESVMPTPPEPSRAAP